MTSTTFASLSVPAIEDSMEVSSSPAANQFDGDIDIDFGDYGGGTHLTDDERMLEDGEPTRPATATDEMMHDDDNTLTAPVPEEVMQDGPETENEQQQDLADEELIDYDDGDTFHDQESAPPVETSLTKADGTAVLEDRLGSPGLSTDLQNEPSRTHNTNAQQESTTSVDDLVPSTGDNDTGRVDHRVPKSDTAQEAGDPLESEETQLLAPDDSVKQGEEDTVQSEELAAEEHDVQKEELESDSTWPAPQLSGSLDTSLSVTYDGPATPTDTGLHPIVLRYEGYEMPLFKSRAQPDGLLKDDNLASVSVAVLLHNCRQRLAIKTDDPVSDDQELCVGIDRMALILSESSRPASGTSLNDILEIYLQLHENDGTEDVPPLALTLTRQIKFDSSLNLFKQAALKGRGMSDFAFLFHSEQENNFQQEDPADDVVNEPSAAAEGQPETQNEDFQDHQKDQEHNNFQGPDDSEPYDHDHEYGPDDLGEPHYGDYDETEEYPDPEEYDEETGIVAIEGSEQPDPSTEAVDPAPENTADDAEDVAEVIAPGSAASSATARNDDANDDPGEYAKEDLIDWDDNDLTTTFSETNADEGNEDFSTYLTEPADASSNRTETGKHQTQGSSAQHEYPRDDTDSSVQHPLGDLGSEDILHYDHPDPDEEDEHADLYNEAGDGLDQYEKQNYDQADNLVYDDQGEVQLGEDEDQFQTAFDDLLEGDQLDNTEEALDTNGAHQEADEQDIHFDDDDNFGDDQPAADHTGNSDSPLGKRSYDEHVDDGELELNAPESKKARSG